MPRRAPAAAHLQAALQGRRARSDGSMPACEDGTRGCLFPAHAGGTAHNTGCCGCSKTATWKNTSTALSYRLLYASVALNITIAKVSVERPVGLCRGCVSPKEVLMNLSAICQPHHLLKSASALPSGWLSVFVARCRAHSDQNQCPGEKPFGYNK